MYFSPEHPETSMIYIIEKGDYQFIKNEAKSFLTDLHMDHMENNLHQAKKRKLVRKTNQQILEEILDVKVSGPCHIRCLPKVLRPEMILPLSKQNQGEPKSLTSSPLAYNQKEDQEEEIHISQSLPALDESV